MAVLRRGNALPTEVAMNNDVPQDEPEDEEEGDDTPVVSGEDAGDEPEVYGDTDLNPNPINQSI